MNNDEDQFDETPKYHPTELERRRIGWDEDARQKRQDAIDNVDESSHVRGSIIDEANISDFDKKYGYEPAWKYHLARSSVDPEVINGVDHIREKHLGSEWGRHTGNAANILGQHKFNPKTQRSTLGLNEEAGYDSHTTLHELGHSRQHRLIEKAKSMGAEALSKLYTHVKPTFKNEDDMRDYQYGFFEADADNFANINVGYNDQKPDSGYLRRAINDAVYGTRITEGEKPGRSQHFMDGYRDTVFGRHMLNEGQAPTGDPKYPTTPDRKYND